VTSDARKLTPALTGVDEVANEAALQETFGERFDEAWQDDVLVALAGVAVMVDPAVQFHLDLDTVRLVIRCGQCG
jgi:hypothetical protein